jgi:antitoxin component of MazEF toxin-antitoxin module
MTNMISAVSSPIHIPQDWDLRVCVVLWLAIAAMQIAGNSLIRAEVRYGVVAYRFLKTMIAIIFAFILVGTLLGTAGSPSYRLGFTAVALVWTILDLRHIIRRNNSKVFFIGKTTMGIVNFEDSEEVELTLSAAASIIRHQRMDEKLYASDKSLEEVLEAFDIPSASKFAEMLRREAQERREKLARDKVFAADVELLNKEIHG